NDDQSSPSAQQAGICVKIQHKNISALIWPGEFRRLAHAVKWLLPLVGDFYCHQSHGQQTPLTGMFMTTKTIFFPGRASLKAMVISTDFSCNTDWSKGDRLARLEGISLNLTHRVNTNIINFVYTLERPMQGSAVRQKLA
ncbi:hypothetical protein J0S82_004296, partial [Galemys pyrenaicus]